MTLINSLRALSERCSKSPAFSYVAILLLQLKLVWGYWDVRSIPGGDTSFYFTRAFEWFKEGKELITRSPLYKAYYGSFLHLTQNAIIVTLAHRMVLVFILAGLVLALMRRVFSPGLAWLLTAWWVVLPINFDAMYEIHLFGVIPMLVALVMIDGTTSWRNGVALASLLTGALLVRNELLLVLLPMAVIVAVAERSRRTSSNKRRRSLLLAYGLPSLLCILATAYFYKHAVDARTLSQMMHSKQSENACQVFAFGYQQRHPDQNHWLWAECSHRMQQVFGNPGPTFIEAFEANPGGIMEHFLWNVRLLPGGLQLLLFGAMSGGATPDYNEPARSPLALPFGLGALLLFVVACWLCWKDRQEWRPWFLERKWVLLGLASILPMNAFVILTQRPRPEYLFSLEIALHAALGWALLVVLSRLSPRRIWQGCFAVLAVVMILVWPSYASWAVPETTLSRTYSRLEPSRSLFERAGTRLVTPLYGSELCNYLARSKTDCTAIDFEGLREKIANGRSLESILANDGATLLYADEASMNVTAIRQFVASPSAGWSVAAYQNVGPETWALLDRSTGPALSLPSVFADIVPSGGALALGPGWYDFERYDGVTFRWVNNDAVITFRDLEHGTLSFDLEAGPGNAASGPIKLAVLVDDNPTAASFEVTGRKALTVNKLPSRGFHRLRLHAEGEGKSSPNDSRILRFRVFKISPSGS